MREPTILALMVLAMASLPVHAQSPAPAAPTAKAGATKAAPARTSHARKATQHQAAHATLVPPTPAPVVPPAPPPAAIIPPPDPAPPHPITPPPPPVVHEDAPGEISPLAGGLRLTFGSGRADFNPATQKVLASLAHAGGVNRALVYNLYAHAPGTPEDSSTPRRLSLERGLAVRSALINEGIASTRIYVHAMGAASGDAAAPPDRVDIVTATLDTTPPAAAPPLPAAATARPQGAQAQGASPTPPAAGHAP